MTVTTAISITGLDDVLRSLRELRLDAVRPAIEDVLDEIAKDAARYPAPPPGSRYRRTDKLRDGWLDGDKQVQLSGDTLTATLTNGVSYAAWVQGADDQAAIHAGRWRTEDQIAAAWEDRIAARIEAALERATS